MLETLQQPARPLSYSSEETGLWEQYFQLQPYLHRIPAGVMCKVASLAREAGRELGRTMFEDVMQRLLVTVHHQPFGFQLCWSSDHKQVRVEHFGKHLPDWLDTLPEDGELYHVWHQRINVRMAAMRSEVAVSELESEDTYELPDIPLSPRCAA